MADDIDITPGSGKTVATDEVSARHYQLVKLAFGADGAASMVATGTGLPIDIGKAFRVSQNFTRPANTTQYAVGDLVANNTTAGSVAAMTFSDVVRASGGTGMVRRALLRKSGTTITSAVFRLHLFEAAPATVTNGDNGAFSVSGVADYLGAIDIVVDQAFTDGAAGVGIPKSGNEILLDLTGTAHIYGLLEARAAYTPGNAEVFTVELECVQD